MGNGYFSDYEIIRTSLRFTKPRIYKAITAIKDCAKKSRCINVAEILVSDDCTSLSPEISLIIPLRKRMNRRLDEIFGGFFWESLEKNMDIIYFTWDNRNSENKRFYYFERHGRPLCGERYIKILEGSASYEDCTCPKEFLETCKDLTQILRNFEFRKQ